MQENYGFIKTAMANFNTGSLSNPKINASKICYFMEEASKQQVKLLVLPELSLTGYTCQDLFGTTDLIQKTLLYLQTIISKSSNTDLLTLVGAPLCIDDALYNCAIAVHRGHILGVIPKQYIPNYNEFYEKRWFTPYKPSSYVKNINILNEVVPFGNIIFSSSLGYKLGVEICEDLWSVIPPSSYLSLAGANIIANLSASNEIVGKNEYRKALVQSQSARTISAYVYVSSGFTESTSDLVFGGSGYAFENGKLLSTLERYQTHDQMQIFDIDVEYLANERIRTQTFIDSKQNLNFDITVVNFNQNYQFYTIPYKLNKEINAHPFIPNILDESGGKVCKEILNIQSAGLAKRLISINSTKVTIGISGGLDSTLALLVCVEAFKKLQLDCSEITGITMPGFGTTNRTYDNAVKLCKELGITLIEIPIRDACLQHFKDINHDPSIHDITYENVQARERTKILMNIANKINGIVIGTGDLSELVLGWCTYNGDHMSMYNVNASIPKTLVKYLIEWYARFNCSESLKFTLLDIIDTPISPELLPTDGEKIVQKTESSIGPYEVLDFYIYHLLRNKFSSKKIIFLAENAFKNEYSQDKLKEIYNSFINRTFRNQFKRNCIPDGPKVGSVSISPRGDLRMPSDANATIWLLD